MTDPILGGNGAIDGLGVTPAIHASVDRQEMQSAVSYYNQGLLTPNTYLADRADPCAVTSEVGEDGAAMTDERRRSIAQERADQGVVYLDKSPDYINVTTSIDTEPVGTSAQKHVLPLRIAPPARLS